MLGPTCMDAHCAAHMALKKLTTTKVRMVRMALVLNVMEQEDD